MSEAKSSYASSPQAARIFGADLRSLNGDPRIRYLGGIAVLIGLYYGAAHIGYAVDFAGPVASIVWLPAGVGIAFLYLAGMQFWPGVVVGDLLVNNYMALPIGSAIGQTCGNLLEVVVATWLLQRFAQGRSLNRDVGGVCRTLVAIAVGTAISATIGALSLRLGNVVATRSLAEVWRTWWLGDFSGALLVVPLALAWFRPLDVRRPRWGSAEIALALAAVVVSSELAWRTNQPLTYIVFPALIWTAFRLGPRWATLAVLVAASFAVGATAHYVGPFHSHALSRSVLEAQLFIAVASVSAQCIAAVVYEREKFAQRLWASRARLVRAGDVERKRVERNLHDGAQQRLAGLVVRLDLEVQESSPEARPALEAVRGEVAVAIDELRELAQGRHPAVLTDRGLAAAIGDIAKRSAIPTEVAALPMVRLGEAAEATAYYVVAEAVANAQKHGRPSSIRVSAETVGGTLQVEVRDDGIGGAIESSGSGLEGLRDRVEALGGSLTVASPLGGGTRIRAQIPESPVAS